MKIDEDLIFEQYEKIRDNLYEYFELAFCQEERDMHLKPLVKIVMPWSEFLSKVKHEQEVRNSDYDTSGLIGRTDSEFDSLNQERMKYFEF